MPFQALKVGELAARTGLSIRTLHHYDEIGLLKPSLHTESGHRLYTERDIARLQQVISLRQLGFSLNEARACLDRADFSPLKVLTLHRSRVEEKIEQHRRLRDRLDAIANRLDRAEPVTPEEFLKAIEEMTTMETLYTPEEMKQFAEAAKDAGPEEIEAVQNGWTKLIADVRASTHLAPSTPEAQALADRWDELTERTTRGFQKFPKLQASIADHYQQGHFEGHDRAPQAADFAFIERIKAARKSGGVTSGG